ncbi:MAG: hypothetical protein ACPGJF_10520 [Sinimarinibacterium flocculans]|uniref:hypothetical protein n=1 Tax=Sinimarinibacterium flocculans TaxID=985250 RepID=UPI003C45C3BA
MKFTLEEIEFVKSTVRLSRFRIAFSLAAMAMGVLSCAFYAWLSGLYSQPIDAIVAQVGEENAAPLKIAFELGWKKGMVATTSLVVGGVLFGSGIATLLGFSNKKLNSLLKRIATEA